MVEHISSDSRPLTPPLNADDLTNLVMQRLRDHSATFLPMAPVIAQFCSVRLEPIGTWFVNPTAKPLGGIITLKLWYLQQQMGLDCPEIEAVTVASPYGATIGKLLAYDVITPEQARALCGGVKDNAVLKGARGSRIASPQLTIAQLQQRYRVDLQAAIETLQEQAGKHQPAGLQITPATPDHQVEPVSEASPSEPAVSLSSEKLIELLAARLNLIPETLQAAIAMQTAPVQADPPAVTQHQLIRDIAATLAQAHVDVKYALEVLTPEEQAFLKRLVGDELPFNLKNALAALCGSRAKQLSQGE